MQNLQNNREIIVSVINKYQRNGKTNWKQAFVAQPELKTTLGIETQKDKQNLYAYTHKLRKEIGISKISISTPKSRAPIQQKTEGLRYVKFCACCGASLEAMDLALRLSKGE